MGGAVGADPTGLEGSLGGGDGIDPVTLPPVSGLGFDPEESGSQLHPDEEDGMLDDEDEESMKNRTVLEKLPL